jgi:hypothetical protein
VRHKTAALKIYKGYAEQYDKTANSGLLLKRSTAESGQILEE